MTHPAPSLRQLRCFVVTSRWLNFSRAAEALHLSQPALSLAIRELEQRLGVRLLDRSTKNVRLTAAGDEFLVDARRILSTFDDAVANVRGLAELERGRVAVAGLPSLAYGLLPRAIASFRARHPGVKIQLNEALTDETLSLVRHGRCDIGFAYVAGTDDQIIESTPLLEDELVVAVPRGHRLARAARITWEQLADEPIVGITRASSTRQVMEQAFACIGHVVEPVFEVSQIATAGALAAQGLGIAIVPRLAVPLFGRLPLTVRPVVEPSASRSIVSLVRSDRSPSPSTAAFLDIVSALVEGGGSPVS